MKPTMPVNPMIPAHEPDKAETKVLQYSTAEKLFLIALSEKATTDPMMVYDVTIYLFLYF